MKSDEKKKKIQTATQLPRKNANLRLDLDH